MTDTTPLQARLVSLGSVPAQTRASPPTDSFAAHISSFSFGNPGPAAWSVVLRERHAPSAPIRRRIIFGSVDHATDNAMKLKAATMALASLPLQARGTVWSDSEYAVKGVNEWLPKWQRSSWRDGKGKPVKNMPEWMTLAALQQQRPDVSFGWVRSHSGSRGDELAKTLARSEAEKIHLGQRPVTEITVNLGHLGSRLT